ncbi:hypothetical protein HYU18_00240 [Candidatus Woesearchaeota archaeon]|nr:hypothetical protein [Candidatus Woesearchaeota archaeon]
METLEHFCEKCGLKFPTKEELESHKASVHVPEEAGPELPGATGEAIAPGGETAKA